MSSLEKVVGREYVARFNKKGITTFEGLIEFYDNNQQELYLFLLQIEENDLDRVELNLRIEKAATQYMLEYIDNQSENASISIDNKPSTSSKKPFYKKIWFWGVMLVVLYYGGKLILLNIENRKYYEENRKRQAEWKASVESNNLENQKPKQSEADLNFQKKLVGEWKCEKVINSMLSKRERRDISKIQLLFSEEFYRTKQGYRDYGEVLPYYIKDGKFYESKSYSSFDSIWFKNDRSMSLTYSQSGYGTIELQFKKIK